MSKAKEKPIASICVHQASAMTSSQRKEIAAWMRDQAKGLLREGENYSTRFRAAFYWATK